MFFSIPHDVEMRRKNTKTESRAAARARLLKEIAKPLMAMSARIAERNLDSTRIAAQPSVIMPGTVDRIIASLRRSNPEKAQIAVDGAHRPHRNLRIDNTLLDEDGENVKLKKGARVSITVTADPTV
jgi:hypothetical protein